MAKKKKKGGGKKGGSKKGGSKKGKKGKDSKKGPTEKELFEMQVEKLRQELEAAVERLGQRNEDLTSARDLLGWQVDRKESCVAHLQGVLKKEFEHRLQLQDRLQTERDLAELVEDRALGKFVASERSGAAARSHFLQQKMELEGKLSLLEELRLERNSQRAHLRRAEAALEERAMALRAKGREEDSSQADRLLKNREEFLRMCSATRVEWRSAFDLRLPVHARRQLEENVRLRCECEGATEELLSQQGRNRALRSQRKAIDLEEEIQASADEYVAGRRSRQEERIRRLEQILLLSSLLMGTSFLSEVPEDGGSNNGGKSKNEATSYLANHPLLTGAAAIRSPGCAGDTRRGQFAEDDEDDDLLDDRDDRYPYGRPPPPRRRQRPSGDSDNPADECLVRFGLHYSSCFSKSKDFDDKLDQLQHHVQSWPRGDGRGSTGSPCSTLQLLAKVKSSPLFERCQGNQYVVRTPYHMYNVKGELRYIVQDPPHLEQCYLEAQCSIPGDLCRGYLGGSYRGRSPSIGRCESKHCHHTLLAWDPDTPDAGTFFDVFEYSCCCSCQLATHRQHSSQQVIG